MSFNPRPRAGANSPSALSSQGTERFNPRPRAGANIFGSARAKGRDVSIHAPARGRTEGG
jgi:hypothetical protein